MANEILLIVSFTICPLIFSIVFVYHVSKRKSKAGMITIPIAAYNSGTHESTRKSSRETLDKHHDLILELMNRMDKCEIISAEVSLVKKNVESLLKFKIPNTNRKLSRMNDSADRLRDFVVNLKNDYEEDREYYLLKINEFNVKISKFQDDLNDVLHGLSNLHDKYENGLKIYAEKLKK